MRRAERSISLLTVRVPTQSGELSVGAYAARQRRRRVAVGALGVALAAAGLSTYWVLRPAAGTGDDYRVAILCGRCHYQGWVSAAAGRTQLEQCPQCHQGALLERLQCDSCRRQFARPPRQPVLVCPDCGSEEVGAPR